MLWDRGYWEPEGNETPEEALAKGDLKFTLEGERLHGSWVLVRMKNDRTGGKRTNWLLIKHRDAFSRDGNGDAILADDTSIASGRTMAAITEGKGTGPKPFMLAGSGPSEPDAVWDSNHGSAAEKRRQKAPAALKKTPSSASRKSSDPPSGFHRRRSSVSPSSGRRPGRAGYMRSSSTAIAYSFA